jgi:hypothetical protein
MTQRAAASALTVALLAGLGVGAAAAAPAQRSAQLPKSLAVNSSIRIPDSLPWLADLIPGANKPDQGKPVTRTVKSVDGKTFQLIVYSSRVRPSVHQIDPFSREGYYSTRVAAKIKGLKAGDTVRAKLSVGYAVGYPISFSPEGVKVTMNTPSMTLTGQASASLNPNIQISGGGGGGSIGSVTGDLGAQATVIPSHQVSYTIAPGAVKDVPVTEFNMTSDKAEVMLTDGHMSFTGAMGPVMMRPWARLSIETSTGVYELELHDTHSTDIAL